MKQRGFTLIELLITLAIAAILATVAVPAFSTFLARQQMASDVNQMISVLSFARSEAIKQREETSVKITQNGVWQIEVSRSGDTIRLAEGNSPKVSVSGDGTFRFDSLGTSKDDCGCEFTVSHTDTAIESRIIKISPAGGIRREKPDNE